MSDAAGDLIRQVKFVVDERIQADSGLARVTEQDVERGLTLTNLVARDVIPPEVFSEVQPPQHLVLRKAEGGADGQKFFGDSRLFKAFLRDNCLDEIVFWFGEELKTDNRECNKAWRAFQRMLLEGIQADVKAVRADQEVIRQDLQTLGVIREQLDQLKDSVDRRLPNEPFQKEVSTALTEIQSVLQDVAQTTKRTEEKVDIIVKTLLSGKSEEEEPKIPEDIQALFDEGLTLRHAGQYEEARTVYQKAKELAADRHDQLAVAEANRHLSVVLNEWDKDSPAAVTLLQECLQEFRTLKAEKFVAKTLFYLGAIETERGDIDLTDSYLSQALEIAKKNDMKLLTASILHQLGWLEHRRGQSKRALELYEQAISLFLSVSRNGDVREVRDATHGVALCYHHRGLIHEHLGNVEEVELNFMRALEWNRKSETKPEIGKVLWLLARLKCREGAYDVANGFLEEASSIFTDLEDYGWLARCLDLKGRLHYTLEQTEEAKAVFKVALAAAERAGDEGQQAVYLDKLGQIYLNDKKLGPAKEYMEKAKEIFLREGSLDGYADSIMNLAQVAQGEGNREERDRLLSEGIETLGKLLLSVHSESGRAFITGKIGFFYQRMENFPQALLYYQRAKKSFESLSDVAGVATSLGSIAYVKGLMGSKAEEFDCYRECKKLVDGTPHYNMIAGAAINLGEINMQIGNLDEAKMLFQEADFYCRKYNLPAKEHLRREFKRLNELIGMRRPPELNFEQMLNELFGLVDWFPEAKDSILRLWVWGRIEMLLGNFRSLAGVKFMICQDDLKIFSRLADILHPYSDLCLQVINAEYPGTGMDIVPFPEEKDLFFDCSIPVGRKLDDGNVVMGFKRGWIHSRYHVTSDTAQSKITGNEGVVLMGWALGLPDQAHELILSSSAAELIERKVFFLPYVRNLLKDKLLNDLSFFGKEFKLVPVYFDSLPKSENVTDLHSTRLNLPVLSAADVEGQRRSLRKVRHAFQNLLSVTKDSALQALNDFTFEIDELADACEESRSIKIQVHVLEFPGVLDKELHIALVVGTTELKD